MPLTRARLMFMHSPRRLRPSWVALFVAVAALSACRFDDGALNPLVPQRDAGRSDTDALTGPDTGPIAECTVGETRCDADVLLQCIDPGAWSPIFCNSSDACTGPHGCRCNAEYGACEDRLCSPGATRCGTGADAARVLLCDGDGMAEVAITDCAESGEICVAGQCLLAECPLLGASQCFGTARWACGEGNVWQMLEDCFVTEQYCTEGAMGPECVNRVCVPGTQVCGTGDAIRVCNPYGDGWGEEQLCGASENCFGGTCRPQVCDPLALTCRSGQVVICEQNGTHTRLDPCFSGTICPDGGSGCVAQICSPGQRRCSGDVIQQCDGIGLSWDEVERCGSDEYCTDARCEPTDCRTGDVACTGDRQGQLVCVGGFWVRDDCDEQQYCDAATCEDQVCIPGTVRCAGAAIETCGALGDGWQRRSCGEGNVCLAGTCVPQQCVPGDTVCDGPRTVQGCDEPGLYTYTTCASTQYCAGGACVAQACTPDEARCDGDTPEVCSWLGDGWNPTTPCTTPAQTCEGEGECVCAPGYDVCGILCVDQSTNDSACGASCQVCVDGTRCVEGVCQCESSDETLCGASCVDTSASITHCGDCDQPCPAPRSCEGGHCVCPAGQQWCDASCVDRLDEAYCGDCFTRCDATEHCTATGCAPNATCFDGIQNGDETGVDCGGSCDACGCPGDQVDCDAAGCQPLTDNDAHCGACFAACEGGSSCVGTLCECPGAEVFCTPVAPTEPVCTDLTTNANCGGCGVACVDGRVCTEGLCCAPDQLNCGGACVSPTTEAHCGDCAPCGADQACVNGGDGWHCEACEVGLTFCPGFGCVSLNTSEFCGDCDVSCTDPHPVCDTGHGPPHCVEAGGGGG